MAPIPSRAVIFLPGTRPRRDLTLCLDYCETHHYRLVAVVRGGNAQESWRDVQAMLHDDDADVVVIVRRNDLPPERTQRVEAVNDPPSITPQPRGRRPQRIQ